MKIQSFSDIITNSSSELFIIHNPKENGDKITEFLQELYNLLKRNIDNDMCIEPVGTSQIQEVAGEGYNCKKGDLLIWSSSENSIPYPIMDLIEGLPYLIDGFKGVDIERHHLG